MELTRIERGSVSDDVYDQLVDRIVTGDVEAGDPLPSERALADALGVSRPVVREALKRLAHAGLVRIRHGGATTVTDYRRTAGPDLLAALLLDADGNLDLPVARSIVEARSEIGPPVAAAAARRAEDADLAHLDVIVGRMRAAADVEERQRHALDFWDGVVDASRNVVYRLLFNTLRRAYEPVMAALAPVMAREVSDTDGHAAVVDALRSRDPEAAVAAVAAVVAHGAGATVEVLDTLLADAPAPDPVRPPRSRA